MTDGEHDKGRPSPHKHNAYVRFLKKKTPSIGKNTRRSLSVKNEGYNHEPLRRLVLRRVEQCTLTVAVPSFEYGYIKLYDYGNCVKTD